MPDGRPAGQFSLHFSVAFAVRPPISRTSLRCDAGVWRNCPAAQGGCALDPDSTRLLYEDGHQEDVLTGCTRMSTKPSPPPLLWF